VTENQATTQRLPFDTRTILVCIVLPIFWVIGAIWLADVPAIILANVLFGAQMLSVIGLASAAVFSSRAMPVDHPHAGFISGMIWSAGLFALLQAFWMLYWGLFSIIPTLMATDAVPVFENGPGASSEEFQKKLDEFNKREGFLSREGVIWVITWAVMLVWTLPLVFANAVIRRAGHFSAAIRRSRTPSWFPWRFLLGGALMLTVLVMSWRATMLK
jgi:hypothetical protein